jgi:hypothetical protein
VSIAKSSLVGGVERGHRAGAVDLAAERVEARQQFVPGLQLGHIADGQVPHAELRRAA